MQGAMKAKASQSVLIICKCNVVRLDRCTYAVESTPKVKSRGHKMAS